MAGVHPTIDEQLEGIARLIERTVERHDDDPSADRLRAAAGTLRRIAGSWSEQLPYLTWDNATTLALLEQHTDSLPAEVSGRVQGIAANDVEPLDARAAQDRNVELRGVLADAIQSLTAEAADTRAAFTAHLRERIARDPSSGKPRR